jgi:hypothetical protein
MLRGFDNRENETLVMEELDPLASYKLLRLKNCTVELKGGVKTLYIKECTGCKISVNFVQGALFVDKAESTEVQVTCHQVRP